MLIVFVFLWLPPWRR